MSTFAAQRSLPRLPVPPLAQSLKAYLASVKPLLNTAQLAKTEAAVQQFLSNQGPILQQRLLARDKSQPNSWLEDWWLKLAYHSWREPSMINSNWYLLLKPHKDFTKIQPVINTTDIQLHRAAGLISNLLDYKESIDSETLAPDMQKSGPICMNQVRLMFGVTRVPKESCDENVGTFPCKAKHITVLIKDQIFSVNVFDQHTGGRLPIMALKAQLASAVTLAKSTTAQPSICLLTSEHRDKWAKAYKYLMDLDPINRKSMDNIESSIFAVSLDTHKMEPTWNSHANNVFHGPSGHNRWFDKCISMVVDNMARAGCNGEHSPLDAVVPALAFEYAAEKEPAADPANAIKSYQLEPPLKLEWVTDNVVSDAILEAQKNADALIANSNVEVIHFQEFGSDFIKKTAKVSPDAFVQQCLQLTYHRIHHTFAPVYESASTRQFLHGRTETCRSLTTEQAAFVQVFNQDYKLSNKTSELYALFQKACKAHVAYIVGATNGQACDRHLLGLRLCLAPGEPTPEIFADYAYKESTTYRLSTSGLFASKNVMATGFGSVTPDGYGMNYIILPQLIKVGLEAKRVNGAARFKDTLTEVLRDVKSMCERVEESQSKL